jgi:hypothetical protein
MLRSAAWWAKETLCLLEFDMVDPILCDLPRSTMTIRLGHDRMFLECTTYETKSNETFTKKGKLNPMSAMLGQQSHDFRPPGPPCFLKWGSACVIPHVNICTPLQQRLDDLEVAIE